jgi:hypothetical protein
MNLLKIFAKPEAPQSSFRPWEKCHCHPWPKASRMCDHTGLIVGETHGNQDGHWAIVRNSIIGKYATEADAQAAVAKRLGA